MQVFNGYNDAPIYKAIDLMLGFRLRLCITRGPFRAAAITTAGLRLERTGLKGIYEGSDPVRIVLKDVGHCREPIV